VVMAKWEKQTLEDLRRHEGCRLSSYQDTVGVWTIGYGHTGPEVKKGLTITQAEAEELLADDFDEAVVDARRVVASFDALDWVRKTVVVNMAFNMGAKTLSTFHNTIALIDHGMYREAALHMLQSKWAWQVGQRARELAKRMSTGEI
jgi:lysozyme